MVYISFNIHRIVDVDAHRVSKKYFSVVVENVVKIAMTQSNDIFVEKLLIS